MEPVKMPILTEDITFDEIGYTGWIARVRLNPRAGDYDRFVGSLEYNEESETELWTELDLVVSDWNFGDEEGNLLVRPIKRNELPPQVRNHLVREYLKRFAKTVELPKELETNSATSSITEKSDQKTESLPDLQLSTSP